MDYTQRDKNARAVACCSKCFALRYLPQDLLDVLEQLKKQKGVNAAFPRHRPCNALMMLIPFSAPGEPQPTSEKLARALEEARAPATMIAKAYLACYDDYRSKSLTPIGDLIEDALACGLVTIAGQARNGVFDAQGWEADDWIQSPEGRATVNAFKLEMEQRG